MKILLSGGGTGGSVTPLIAIAEELNSREQNAQFLWLGSKAGMERKMIKDAKNESGMDLNFKSIPSGKLRRYWDIHNLIDPIFIIAAFFKSLWIIFLYKPDIILTAGSFVSVPVVWAGWILGVPILVHQQDVKIGLANKLMAPFASIITVSLEESVNQFRKKAGSHKVSFTGNAVRKKVINAAADKNIFNLEKELPTLLILGGGTGALAVNKIIIQIIPQLIEFCQIIHVTGENKNLNSGNERRYHPYPFLNNIEKAFALSDLVISRCGMGVLSELAVLGKPAILIPMPDSHQEMNAKYFSERKVAIVLNQSEMTPENLLETITNLLANKKLIAELSDNMKEIMPQDGAIKIAEYAIKLKRL